MVKYPTAIMSFDRPEYLRVVLRSLKAQTAQLADEDVFLFQDGYRHKAGHDLTDPRRIEDSIKIFTEIFPASHVFYSEQNLGVAFNFDRAERFFFEQKNSESALFFEDDLVLSPFYIQALAHLVRSATAEPRLGYVAAYGVHQATLDVQREHSHELILMAHKWGFGLTKRQWLLQKPIMEPYLEILSRANYRDRDENAIRAYYAKLGFASRGTSQDAMKDVASAVLGTTKLMSYVCYGHYIGELGLHSDAASFSEQGYAQTQVYPELVEFEPITEDMLTRWSKEQRRAGLEALELQI